MMSNVVGRLGQPLPRPVRIFGLPALYVALVLFFVFWGFPYERIGEQLAVRIEADTGVRVDFDELGPYLGLLGPGFEATQVVAVPRSGDLVNLERVRMRPAWSTSWLRGDPAVFLDVRSGFGRAAGAVTLGEARGFDGDVSSLDVSARAVRSLLPFDGLDGTLDAVADLVFAEAGPDGSLAFELSDGSLAVPGNPIAIPFDRLDGDLAFGGDAYLTVESMTLSGPMVSGTATGRIGDPGRRGFTQAPLTLQVELEVEGAAVRGALQDAGVRLDRDGRTRFDVSGSMANPRVR